ncbi:helix-turn-helix domain-containing protein, partial [Bacteroides timonensis]|uniref:helix-turn-helix domain-containing protein n=1 Tax=Bacteroides timonensis TaxID=1470345 RepID=UPI001FCC6B29
MQQNTGLKFPQYINKLKLEYAAKLLQEQPDYSVDAIAKMCGIDSRQHFHRLFSEYL